MGATRKRKSNRASPARDSVRSSIADEPPSAVAPEPLKTVRARLVVAVSAARLCGTALAAQGADVDCDAAFVLRHCVCHSLDAGIRALDEIIAGGAS